MSNMQDWYAPLEEHTSPESEKKKRKPGKASWRIGGAILLVVLLIAASSLIFSGSNQRTEAPYISGDGMPDDWNDYLDNYYQVTESKDAEIKLPRAELAPDFKVTLSNEHGKELSLQELYDQCSKSIVAIKGYQDGVDGYYWGSGIILSKDGLILTNTHVIENCDTASVTLFDNSSYDAALVGADSTSDIAVLRIEATGLTPASFGDSAELAIGDKVAAIGNPLGETFRMTLTDGIISAIDRGISYNGHSMTLLQTNTAINEGNSGGALFNMYGQVIGVTNMKMMSSYSSIEGIGFAIPSSTIAAVADSLMQYGEVRGRTAIGITVGAIPENVTSHYDLPTGLYVSAVEEKSDAAAKGIQQGDIITAVNGNPASATSDILTVKNTLSVGDTITFTIWRDGETFDVDVTLVDENDLK
ncbi:MAG: trypsin-like peptidase domain-containing protein [Candidatus Limivicinus sp.]|nr:trypsin-like peptidase domain-containing protein [Candidatus Limivicinus sp.]